MNEQNPEVLVEPAIPYKDRSVGLIIFGSLTILMGCLAALMILFMLIGMAAATRTQSPSAPISTILPVTLIYGILGVVLVWLGIGSIMARRWARALLLIFSWSSLVMGLFVLIFMAFFIPKILAGLHSAGTTGQPAMPPMAIGMIMVFTGLILGIFFIVVPGIWAFFYNSRHVKATCEARDPVARWTDACPLPLLGFCLWLGFSMLMMLFMPVMNRGVMPFFGMFLTGLPGTLFCAAIAAIWGYAAWLLYHLNQRGWWLILMAMILFMASSMLTYSRHDVMEMYQLMGYPPAKIDQLQKYSVLTGNNMNWITLFSTLPFLGYLVFIKKYLRRAD
jgi:hypothetical protein